MGSGHPAPAEKPDAASARWAGSVWQMSRRLPFALGRPQHGAHYPLCPAVWQRVASGRARACPMVPVGVQALDRGSGTGLLYWVQGADSEAAECGSCLSFASPAAWRGWAWTDHVALLPSGKQEATQGSDCVSQAYRLAL